MKSRLILLADFNTHPDLYPIKLGAQSNNKDRKKKQVSFIAHDTKP